jgi:hypothetical protein
MPSLVSLVMGGIHRITDATVKIVAPNAPNLQIWILWKCANITDDGTPSCSFSPSSDFLQLIGVTAIGNNNHLLTHIQLSDCSRISDKGVRELALGCPLLTTVLLGGYVVYPFILNFIYLKINLIRSTGGLQFQMRE